MKWDASPFEVLSEDVFLTSLGRHMGQRQSMTAPMEVTPSRDMEMAEPLPEDRIHRWSGMTVPASDMSSIIDTYLSKAGGAAEEGRPLPETNSEESLKRRAASTPLIRNPLPRRAMSLPVRVSKPRPKTKESSVMLNFRKISGFLSSHGIGVKTAEEAQAKPDAPSTHTLEGQLLPAKKNMLPRPGGGYGLESGLFTQKALAQQPPPPTAKTPPSAVKPMASPATGAVTPAAAPAAAPKPFVPTPEKGYMPQDVVSKPKPAAIQLGPDGVYRSVGKPPGKKS